jgi:hypothetical protein
VSGRDKRFQGDEDGMVEIAGFDGTKHGEAFRLCSLLQHVRELFRGGVL